MPALPAVMDVIVSGSLSSIRVVGADVERSLFARQHEERVVVRHRRGVLTRLVGGERAAEAEVAGLGPGGVPREVVGGARIDVQVVWTGSADRNRRERGEQRRVTGVNTEAQGPDVVVAGERGGDTGAACERLISERQRARLCVRRENVPVGMRCRQSGMRGLTGFGRRKVRGAGVGIAGRRELSRVDEQPMGDVVVSDRILLDQDAERLLLIQAGLDLDVIRVTRERVAAVRQVVDGRRFRVGREDPAPRVGFAVATKFCSWTLT